MSDFNKPKWKKIIKVLRSLAYVQNRHIFTDMYHIKFEHLMFIYFRKLFCNLVVLLSLIKEKRDIRLT